MHQLGLTRSVLTATHSLQTPDTFVRIRLPGLEKGMAIVHTSPAIGARFSQYTLEMESDGKLGPTTAQRFVYVISGTAAVTISETVRQLGLNDFAYLPEGLEHSIVATSDARIEVFEKPYLSVNGEVAPEAIFGSEGNVPADPLLGDPALLVRSLLPASMQFDFAVNTMEFQPGASLAMVEMHVMEHGLIMLQGGGIYRVSDQWYPITTGDFIWMAPYCPQWFCAVGKTPAKYLIYKDWNRSPLV